MLFLGMLMLQVYIDVNSPHAQGPPGDTGPTGQQGAPGVLV